MNESMMQAVLMQHAIAKRYQLTAPNLAMLYAWEADLISATNAWLVHEYEIKVSRSDFLADSNKRAKHASLAREFASSPGPRKPRDEVMQSLLDQGWLDLDLSRKTPNYFWYATNGFEIDPSEIPHYAGWLRIKWHERFGRYGVRVEKQAPRLHSEKLSERKRLNLARWLSYKLSNMYNLRYLKEQAQ